MSVKWLNKRSNTRWSRRRHVIKSAAAQREALYGQNKKDFGSLFIQANEASRRSSQRPAASPRCRGLPLPAAPQRFDLGRGNAPKQERQAAASARVIWASAASGLEDWVLLNSGASQRDLAVDLADVGDLVIFIV